MQKDLDIKEYIDTSHDVMIPHTAVLGRNLEIFKVYNGYYYWGRPSMAELNANLRELARECALDPSPDPAGPCAYGPTSG